MHEPRPGCMYLSWYSTISLKYVICTHMYGCGVSGVRYFFSHKIPGMKVFECTFFPDLGSSNFCVMVKEKIIKF